MPIYEYRCTSCQDDFEVTQRITDAPLAECPKCQGRLEKLISQTSFVLKGNGWYMTDYARKNAPSEGKDSGGKDSGGPTKAASEGACSQAGSKPSCSGCAASSDT